MCASFIILSFFSGVIAVLSADMKTFRDEVVKM